MKNLAIIFCLLFVFVGCYSPTSIDNNNNNSNRIILIFDPRCGCTTAINRDTGDIFSDGSVRAEVTVSESGSTFSVRVSGGQEPYILWVNDEPIRNPYPSGSEVNLDAGTYAVFVTDFRGIASNRTVIELTS